jgi:hypothetical protein
MSINITHSYADGAAGHRRASDPVVANVTARPPCTHSPPGVAAIGSLAGLEPALAQRAVQAHVPPSFARRTTAEARNAAAHPR